MNVFTYDVTEPVFLCSCPLMMNEEISKGYPCFVVSIAMIGVCTAVIGDVAGHLGCFIYLKDSVNAIAFVALGTSVPGKDHVNFVGCCDCQLLPNV